MKSAIATGVLSAMLCPFGALAQGISHEYGIEFVTVGNVNNAATPIPRPGRIEPDETMPAGSVGYEYRIGRLEITTGQWLQFVNTFSTQSDDLRFFAQPTTWGARLDSDYEGPGLRWRLADSPDAAMRPVYGISWREAAMYCNWRSATTSQRA